MPRSTFADFEVLVPAHLERSGASVTARIGGNPAGPLVVALGGISANRFVAEAADGGGGWWAGLVGSGCAIDPARHRILGLDFAADESGGFAPSTADQAEVLAAAIRFGAPEEKAIILGASYGGMVGLALAQQRPELVAKLVILSAPASPHPAATATRELQRRTVKLGLEGGRGEEALAIARGFAMLTYRTSGEFEQRFTGGIGECDPLACSAPGAYLRARGAAYKDVMSPGRFLSLSASIDRHQVQPERIAVPALVIGASTDQLVPPCQMEQLASALPNAELHILDSLYGHDMFLKESDRIGPLVTRFLEQA